MRVIPVSDKDRNVLETIAELRIFQHLKLPDAIIAGTAINNNAVLLTNDKAFSKIPLLKIEVF
ncbi:MAG TPA: PIN domain-containing protein [Segetibacter sp.]